MIDFNYRPHFQNYETEEPLLRDLVFKYYRQHFDELESVRFTEQYFDLYRKKSNQP